MKGVHYAGFEGGGKGGELREWSTRKGRKQILLEHSAVDTLTLVK